MLIAGAPLAPNQPDATGHRAAATAGTLRPPERFPSALGTQRPTDERRSRLPVRRFPARRNLCPGPCPLPTGLRSGRSRPSARHTSSPPEQLGGGTGWHGGPSRLAGKAPAGAILVPTERLEELTRLDRPVRLRASARWADAQRSIRCRPGLQHRIQRAVPIVERPTRPGDPDSDGSGGYHHRSAATRRA